jgi:hypothetical protein
LVEKLGIVKIGRVAREDFTLGDIKTNASVTVKCKMVDGKKVAISISEKAVKGKKAESAAAPAAEPAAAPAK